MPSLLSLEEALRVSSAIRTPSECQSEVGNSCQQFALKRLENYGNISIISHNLM
jgi:hypothetical protein